jgi:uncharacterized protein YndB with AHSA1/START domain
MSTMSASVTVRVDAPAEVVYALIADVSRMGEWSPECVSCEWLDEPGELGSQFRGHNRRGLARWSTTAKVVAATPGHEFAFTTAHHDRESTRWRYQLRPVDDATEVTESFDAVFIPTALRVFERIFMPNRRAQLEAGMTATLERIRATAEATQAHDADR